MCVFKDMSEIERKRIQIQKKNKIYTDYKSTKYADCSLPHSIVSEVAFGSVRMKWKSVLILFSAWVKNQLQVCA